MVAKSLKQDPVAERLSQSGDARATAMLNWMEGRRARSAWGRRAFWCAFGGWLLVTVSAVIAAAVAWNFSFQVQELYSTAGYIEIDAMPRWTRVVPQLLILLAVGLVIGGIYAWKSEQVPGLSTTRRAIDWANTSDAVSKLLSAGCTYPEAFKTAAQVTLTKSNRNWLLSAASRVERGQQSVSSSGTNATGDAVIVELLVDSNEEDPSQSWRTASQHFREVARQRLGLLLSMTPVLSTLFAGLIIWMAMSTTLGWMWRMTVQVLNDLGSMW